MPTPDFPSLLTRARAAYDRGLAGQPSRWPSPEDASENLGLHHRMIARPPRSDLRTKEYNARFATVRSSLPPPKGARWGGWIVMHVTDSLETSGFPLQARA